MPTYPNPAEARERLESELREKPDTYLLCRDPGIRHPWTVERDFYAVERPQEGRRVQWLARRSVCMRCNAKKHEEFFIGVNGLEKVGNYYTYPDGYQIPGVPRGTKPSGVIWQENSRRATERAAQAYRTASS